MSFVLVIDYVVILIVCKHAFISVEYTPTQYFIYVKKIVKRRSSPAP